MNTPILDTFPVDSANAALLAGMNVVAQEEPVLDPVVEQPTASRLLGAGCVHLMLQNDPRKAKVYFQRASRSIPDPSSRPFLEADQIQHLTWTAAMFGMYTQPTRVANLRAKQHEGTVEAIQHASSQAGRSQPNRAAHGDYRARLTTLALLTRLHHPGLFAMQAFPHKSTGPTTRHTYDILAAEATDNSTGYKLRIQKGCLGLCTNNTTQIAAATARYSTDITLVSAHCDLWSPRDNESHPGGTIVRGLQKELAGTATETEIRELDTATNSLLLAISGDPRRHGTLPAA